MSLSDALEIRPLDKPPRAAIQVPGSKSIVNRALVLAALTAKGYACTLRGVPRCEDAEVMIECLRALGFRILTEWPEELVFVTSRQEGPLIPASAADLHVGNSGTTMRFLTAIVSLGQGRYRLDGDPRMRQRPIEDLLTALRQLGVSARCENDDGCPPVIVETTGLRAGEVFVKGHASSQFLSGLLMALGCVEGSSVLQIQGLLVSRPYIELTIEMMRRFCPGSVQMSSDFFHVVGGALGLSEKKKAAPFPEPYAPRRHLPMRDYQIEPDASSASYFWAAAAILGGEVTVPGLRQNSLQGDIAFLNVLEDMGCLVAFDDAGAMSRGGPVRGIDVDMNDISDTVMTLAAVACFAEGPTTIRNVAHIRHKESDRIAAIATELCKVGAGVEEYPDGLKITPGPLHGAVIETYNDHRIAMSMALIGLKVPGIVIKNPGCVAKTYPRFFDDLEKLRS